MKRDLIAHEDPKSHVSEIFRTLRTNVQFMNSNKKLRTLLVTSTIPGEGKTWISSNLAITFAQAGKKVILIDADMRKCGLHNIFKVPLYPGLSNYLAGFNENNEETSNIGNYLRETEVPNLILLPAGNIPPNPSELLASRQMSTLLEKLKEMCDLIIIDGTPSKLVTDATVLSRIVDYTIVVVGHNMAKKEDLSKVIKDIKNVGGNIAGLVYNKKPSSRKKQSETYYYASTSNKLDSPRKHIPKDRNVNIQNEVDIQYKFDMINNIEQDVTTEKTPVEQTQTSGEISQEQTQQSEEMPQEYTQLNGERSLHETTIEMLNQFNNYLQQEKSNRDNRSY